MCLALTFSAHSWIDIISGFFLFYHLKLLTPNICYFIKEIVVSVERESEQKRRGELEKRNVNKRNAAMSRTLLVLHLHFLHTVG